MRTLLLVFWLIVLPMQSQADDWVCPDPNDEFCDSYHAEYIADQADKRMNKVYQQLLNGYPAKKDRQPTINAQRAWLKYSSAHCAAILSHYSGATFTMAEMALSCRAEQIIKRTKELESYCEPCK